MAVTIKDVAAVAQVSVSTVSRAFTAPGQVGAATLTRIKHVAAELGYTPNTAARSLRGGGTATLGVILPDISNPFFPPIFKAMQARARSLGYTLLVVDSDEREADEAQATAAIARKVDGLLVWASTRADEHLAALARETPLVLGNRHVPGVSEVHVDLSEGLNQAAEHLRALGHTRCAFVDGSRTEASRGKSIRESFAEQGLSVDVLGPYEPRFETGLHAATLVAAEEVTAVVAHNDLVALGVLHQLAKLGVDVPRDVSVIGIDDTLLASTSTPSLTTVRISAEEIATRALDLLLEVVADPTREPRTADIGSRLVPRASTGPARRT